MANDKNDNSISNANKSKAYISDGAGKAQDVKLEVADGEKTVPGWMVAHLGGPNKLTDPVFKEAMKSVKYDDFSKSFHAEVAADTLNKVQRNVIQQHMRRLQRLS